MISYQSDFPLAPGHVWLKRFVRCNRDCIDRTAKQAEVADLTFIDIRDIRLPRIRIHSEHVRRTGFDAVPAADAVAPAIAEVILRAVSIAICAIARVF